MKDKLASPPFQLAVLTALAGATAPALALIKGAGVRGALNDAGLLAAVWGLSPFVLVPVLAWIARRPFSRWTVGLLAALAAGFGLLAHFGNVTPPTPNFTAELGFVFVPVWQWPMILLSAAVALIAPAVAVETGAAADAGAGNPSERS